MSHSKTLIFLTNAISAYPGENLRSVNVTTLENSIYLSYCFFLEPFVH